MLFRILDRIFAISEISQSRCLQLIPLCFFISCIITFVEWMHVPVSELLCSPHITHCAFYKSILAIPGLPYSYFETTWYMVLMAVMTLGAYAIYREKYHLVWLSVLILFLYKALAIYVFGTGNYDYYDAILMSVFLFATNKLYFLRIVYVILYFLAATIKFHPGWILGTYFTTLQTGIPWFPDSTTIILTNIVILTQIFLCWGLLARRNTWIFVTAEIFFFFFQFYSGILIEYRYPLSTIPIMLVIFAIADTVPYRRSYNIFSYTLIFLMYIAQSIAFWIPGDQKMTLEGNKYGLYMFEANHQCVTRYQTYYIGGTSTVTSMYSKNSHDRCDPYDAVIGYQRNCTRDTMGIAVTFDHSINGGPFYRIVDQRDLCRLQYIPFVHNSWIKNEYENPTIIGYPVKNYYDGNRPKKESVPMQEGSIIRLPGLENTDHIVLDPIQRSLEPYTDDIIIGYWVLWWLTLGGVGIIYMQKKYK